MTPIAVNRIAADMAKAEGVSHLMVSTRFGGDYHADSWEWLNEGNNAAGLDVIIKVTSTENRQKHVHYLAVEDIVAVSHQLVPVKKPTIQRK